jgi:hypothetical protein
MAFHELDERKIDLETYDPAEAPTTHHHHLIFSIA